MTDQQTSTAPAGTATTAGASAPARAQEGTLVESAPIRPARDAPDPPEGVSGERLVWAEQVAGGNYTHKILARGTTLRLVDLAADACANLLLYNALQPHERLNVADTVKVQWQVYGTTGQLLLSDQGRVLASVLDDTSMQHDAIYGASTLARNTARYGDGTPHGPSPAGRELFLLGALKNGLSRRDLPPSVSFFQGVRIDADGAPRFTGPAPVGSSVTLRIEMAAIVLIANTAHPLDPRTDYACGPIEVLAWSGSPTSPDDPLWNRSPEGRRAFVNTADYLNARGIS